ncbi:hypothetical protein KUCAC02_004315, partial [Chaenocephalus aceratus]
KAVCLRASALASPPTASLLFPVHRRHGHLTIQCCSLATAHSAEQSPEMIPPDLRWVTSPPSFPGCPS